MNPRRRSLLLTRRSAGPATEVIRPNSTSVVQGTLVGGATAHAVLSDQSDASYVHRVVLADKFLTPYSLTYWSGGLTDLMSAGGRGIVSFTVSARCYANGATDPFNSGADPSIGTPTYASMDPPDPIGTLTTSPFTKSGGGNFTEAEVNSMTLQVFFQGVIDGGTPDIDLMDVWVTVTYA